MKSADLSAGDIAAQVMGRFWKGIFFYESVDSTNDLAVTLSEEEELASGTVIISDEQVKGRGRLGRTWISPPGTNIYMSVVLRPEIPPRNGTLLTVAAALACARALRAKSGLKVSIKWPNDLTVSGRKIGGILTEVRCAPETINLAIIGIGINVNIQAGDFPDKIRTIATSMRAETGAYHQRSDVIIMILKEFEHWYKALRGKGRPVLLEEWKRLSSAIGRDVRVVAGGETFSGVAEDIDDEGILILRLPSGVLKRVSAGDLTVLR